jgi:hypothetical protein
MAGHRPRGPRTVRATEDTPAEGARQQFASGHLTRRWAALIALAGVVGLAYFLVAEVAALGLVLQPASISVSWHESCRLRVGFLCLCRCDCAENVSVGSFPCFISDARPFLSQRRSVLSSPVPSRSQLGDTAPSATGRNPVFYERSTALWHSARMADQYNLTPRQAYQARADFAAIEDDPQFMMSQLARIPTRRERARNALAIIFSTAVITTLFVWFAWH